MCGTEMRLTESLIDLASPQTSFGVRLSRIHLEMNA